jgi:hypothetical protein
LRNDSKLWSNVTRQKLGGWWLKVS